MTEPTQFERDVLANIRRLDDRIDNLTHRSDLDAKKHGEHYEHTIALAARIKELEPAGHAVQLGTVADHTERLLNAGRMVDHFRNELVTAREEIERLRALHHTPYVDEEHQGGNCADMLMAQAAENARLAAELATARETLTKFVAASLETDYTVDADLSDGYDTDADEQDAALANIVEMHRVLLVREERLFTAYGEVDKLRAAQPGTVTLPADLKTQIQDEVSIQQYRFDEQTHQGIDAAIRVLARLVESWRPVPAEAEVDPNPEWIADGAEFGTGAGGAR